MKSMIGATEESMEIPQKKEEQNGAACGKWAETQADESRCAPTQLMDKRESVAVGGEVRPRVAPKCRPKKKKKKTLASIHYHKRRRCCCCSGVAAGWGGVGWGGGG